MFELDINLILLVLGVILAFYIFRGFLLWYWKINRIEVLLKNIDRNTRPEGAVYPGDSYEDDIEYPEDDDIPQTTQKN